MSNLLAAAGQNSLNLLGIDWSTADAQRLLAATQDPAVKQQLMDNTSAAIERGAFGIPTIYVTANGQTEMFFGKERIIQIEEMIQQSG